MKYNVPMPSLGADMDQGKLMLWKIRPGDNVIKGQSIAVVETTKSTVEIESFKNGKVLELIGGEGEEIPVGKVIALFEVEGAEPMIETKRIKITPAARRYALDHGLEIESLKGSGSEGQVELRDVEALSDRKAPKSEPPLSGVNLREAIARAMARSKKEIPHYYLKTELQLGKFMNWMDEKNKNLSPDKRLMIPAMIMRAIVLSLKKHPLMNATYVNGVCVPMEGIHPGVAISFKDGGVMVPALLDADKKNLHELNSSFQDLVVRTRKGELKNRELTEGSMTVTNLGDSGADEVLGIIFPPQVCLIGLGRIRKAPVVKEDGSIGAEFVADISLSADHRASDGMTGARFLQTIDLYLKNPQHLEESHGY